MRAAAEIVRADVCVFSSQAEAAVDAPSRAAPRKRDDEKRAVTVAAPKARAKKKRKRSRVKSRLI